MTNLRALCLISMCTLNLASGCAEGIDAGRDLAPTLEETGGYDDGETGYDEGESEGGSASDAGDTALHLDANYRLPVLTCGDGKLQGREECDDGEDNGLLEACTPECLLNVCGDGYLFEGVEACDTGALNGIDQNGVTCTLDCKLSLPQ